MDSGKSSLWRAWHDVYKELARACDRISLLDSQLSGDGKPVIRERASTDMTRDEMREAIVYLKKKMGDLQEFKRTQEKKDKVKVEPVDADEASKDKSRQRAGRCKIALPGPVLAKH